MKRYPKHINGRWRRYRARAPKRMQWHHKQLADGLADIVNNFFVNDPSMNRMLYWSQSVDAGLNQIQSYRLL